MEKHPEWAGIYPLVMIAGVRFMSFYHSEHRQPSSFRDLHPDTDIDLDIRDGDWCWIETRKGCNKPHACKTSFVDTLC